MKKKFRSIFFFLLCFCILISFSHPGFAQERGKEDSRQFVLQLRWKHQFQFAGFYAALEKGYYKDKNLDMEIRPGGPGIGTAETVLKGQADFGVSNSEILLQRLSGRPFVVLAVILQHSPLVLIAHKSKGITTPQDLVGKNVKMTMDTRDVELQAMFVNEGISLDRINVLGGWVQKNDFFDPDVDAVSGYLTNEPYYLLEKNIPCVLIRPSSYGIDFYGDCIFTTREVIEAHPQKVADFRSASIRGWEYAMDHTEEMVDFILSRYNPEKTRHHLMFEAKRIRELMLPNVVEIGHMNPGRWKHIARTFARLNMTDTETAAGYEPEKDFMYNPAPGVDNIRFRAWFITGSVLLGIFFAITIFLVFFNKRLNHYVHLRTRELSEVNQALANEILVRKTAEEKIRILNEDLENRVNLRTKELEFANQDLVRENRERKDAQVALQKSEKKFRTLVNTIPCMVQEINREGVITFSNPVHQEILGYPEDEISGKKIWDFAPSPEEKERIRKFFFSIVHLQRPKDTFAKYRSAVEDKFQFITRDGRIIDVEVQWNHYKEGGADPVGLIAVLTDITEKKKAQLRLEKSEAKYRDLVVNASSAIMRIDPEGIISFFNEFAQKLFGYFEEEVLDRSVFGTIVPDTPEVREQYQVILNYLTRNREKYYPIELKMHDRKENPVWVSWTNKGVYDSLGQLTQILCVGNDVTIQKKAQKEKEALLKRLSRSRKMEMLGLLAGSVAHDLNNILSGVVTYPELLLLDIPEDHPMYGPVTTIRNSGMRAAAVVSDLLTVARGAASQKEVYDLNEMIREHLQSPEHQKLQNTYPDIALQVHLSDDPLYIRCSCVHVNKTIMNLLSNAYEAVTEDGHVSLHTESIRIEGEGACNESGGSAREEAMCEGYAYEANEEMAIGEYVKIIVQDNGPGISKKDLKSVFEPFYTKKAMGRSGTGLGLTIVWSTVKDHDGYITVKSDETGTQFCLFFPKTDAPQEKAGDAGDKSAYMGQNERILVVDDEEYQREIACKILNRLGYEAVSVENGEAAVEYLKTHTVDLLVLDMIMPPGMNGRETYEKILSIRPGQKAIFASGYTLYDDLIQARALGAGGFVKKPYTLKKIGNAVYEELHR